MSFTDSGFILERLLSVKNTPARFVVRRAGGKNYYFFTEILIAFLALL